MIKIHNLGFPRLGENRELKFALERYWRGEIDPLALNEVSAKIRRRRWQMQADCGMDYIPSGDFSLYDHVLDASVMLGAVPGRFGSADGASNLDTYFRMARGQAPDGRPYRALEMTKWFDTNYHFLVPELSRNQTFSLSGEKIFDETRELQDMGYNPKPVLLGPLTWLWLAKTTEEFKKLDLLESLLPVYGEILQRLAGQGVEWIQIDEPILVLDLPPAWKSAFEYAYHRLRTPSVKILLATYFGELGDNASLACRLPVSGLHIDAVSAPGQITQVLDNIAEHKVLSLGLIDGRNVWRTDLDEAMGTIEGVRERFRGALWLAPSCSLLHVPIDLARETELQPTVKSWLAFARQKLAELEILRLAAEQGKDAAETELCAAEAAVRSRRRSALTGNPEVRSRMASLGRETPRQRSAFALRRELQQARLVLPDYPTTTIGSFPQTTEIRMARRDYRERRISETEYNRLMELEIERCVTEQEALGLDVLAHGEPERSDMVEYFGERLDGFLFTAHGWVQSYGSRCVKPPILYGDVSRPEPITVRWSVYAQSLTGKPLKGMLTGPVTLLNWSFVRNDQPRSETAYQLALALRDEVTDLDTAGIPIIQIDEPAFREGLPLRLSERKEYLDWAVRAFRICAGGAGDATQIHTHMCYAEFNDILPAIAALDADVITIETSRSNLELLDAFTDFDYPNGIGPGVFDIHSPNPPDPDAIVSLLKKAGLRIDPERLWVNPDCGLKTRQWDEVRMSLRTMVEAAVRMRSDTAGRSRASAVEPHSTNRRVSA
ncbi:MAG: 5-methyltetrahydropteroyltriglutamate--homocysteine S-methyltransferase [Gammaproteobacteria bacterium]